MPAESFVTARAPFAVHRVGWCQKYNEAAEIRSLAQDAVTGNSRWSSGDWNGDGEFDSSDLVLPPQDQAFLTNAISAQTPRV